MTGGRRGDDGGPHVSLAGRVALVTGGSSGLGRAIVAALVGTGARVAFTYRANAPAAESLVAELGADAPVLALRADVSADAEVARAVEATVARFGALDIVVNNAGITRDGLVLRMSPEDWHAVIETNLSGAVRVSRHALPHLLRSTAGRIVNITSIAGIVGSAGQANYSAAKAALIGMTHVLARELAPRGITVNAIAPGAIDAGIVAGLPEAARRRLVEVIPMGRMGTARDVAALVVYLAGPDAGYITGQVIAVDGGTTSGGAEVTPAPSA